VTISSLFGGFNKFTACERKIILRNEKDVKDVFPGQEVVLEVPIYTSI